MMETESDSADLQPELEKQSELNRESQRATTPDKNTSEGNNETLQSREPDLVDWDGPNDPQNPLNWSNSRKWCLVGLVSAVTFNMYAHMIVVAPAAPELMNHFHDDNPDLESYVMSICIIGFVFEPLFVAPLSELYGRSIILHSSNVLFFIFNIACAISTDLSMFIVFRLIVGLMASSPLTLGGGVITDLMVAEKCARALTIWTMGPLLVFEHPQSFKAYYSSSLTWPMKLLGLHAEYFNRIQRAAKLLLTTLTGPVIGGYLSEGVGWRWVLWFVAILVSFQFQQLQSVIHGMRMIADPVYFSLYGILTIACFILVRETFGPVLLMRKAARLRKETGDQSLRTKFDSTKTAYETFSEAIIRPTKMLLFSPIVTIFDLYIAIIYTYMYLLFTTFRFIFEEPYGFTAGEASLAYLGAGASLILGLLVTGFYSDKVVERIRKTHPAKPEHHLPPMVVGSVLVPIGLFFYGWTAQYKVYWIIPILETGFFGRGMLLGFMPVQFYLVETYTIYAASAVASNTVLRSLFGAVIPLAGQKMYDTLGYGWVNSLLGFIALGFIPAFFALLKYGEAIRTNPKY